MMGEEILSAHESLRQGLGVALQFRVRRYRQETALWAVTTGQLLWLTSLETRNWGDDLPLRLLHAFLGQCQSGESIAWQLGVLVRWTTILTPEEAEWKDHRFKASWGYLVGSLPQKQTNKSNVVRATDVHHLSNLNYSASHILCF